MKIDMKLVLTLLVIASTLGGFYYTTNMRLDDLEETVETLKSEDAKLRKLVNRRAKKQGVK